MLQEAIKDQNPYNTDEGLDPVPLAPYAAELLNGNLIHDKPLLELLINANIPAPKLPEYALYSHDFGAETLAHYYSRFKQTFPDGLLDSVLREKNEFRTSRLLKIIARLLSPEQKEKLRKVAGNDNEAPARFYAKMILVYAGDKAYLPDLLAGLSDRKPGPYSSENFEDQCCYLLDHSADNELGPERARRVYRKFLLKDDYDDSIQGAVSLFYDYPLFDFAEDISLRLAKPSSNNLRGQMFLIMGLIKLRYKPALPRIIGRMDAISVDESGGGYWVSSEALREFADPATGLVIEKQLERLDKMDSFESNGSRNLLIEALGRIGKEYPPAAARLWRIAEARPRFELPRLHALMALVQIGDERALEQLADELKAVPRSAKDLCLMELGNTGLREAIPHCLPCLQSPVRSTRCVAALALLRCGDAGGIETLYKERFAINWHGLVKEELFRYWSANISKTQMEQIQSCLTLAEKMPADTPREWFEKNMSRKHWAEPPYSFDVQPFLQP